MTLDADTKMTRDVVTELVGKPLASAQPPGVRRDDRQGHACGYVDPCSRASLPR